MSYLSLLLALINLATQHPEIFARVWAAVLDGYQAVMDGVEIFKSEFSDVPVPRDLEDTLNPHEVAAEQKFAALVVGQGHRAFGVGDFRKVVKWLLDNKQYLAYVQHIIDTFR
jgi:hypothetical protein